MTIDTQIITVTDALKKWDLNTALKAINQIPTADETWETQQLKGRIFLLLGNFPEAQIAFESALKSKPKAPTLLTGLAEVLSKTGETAAAKDLLENAIQIAPDDADAHFQLGLLYVETGYFEDAIAHLDIAATAMPEDSAPLTLKARALMGSQNLSQAEAVFLAALTRNPRDPEAHYFLSELYFETGAVMKALASLETLLTLMPDHQKAIHTLGFTYFQLSRFKEALPFLEKEQTQNPTNTELQLQIAICLTETGDSPSAIRMLDTLLQNTPADVSLFCAKGMAQLKAKTYKEAMETFKQASKTDPAHYLPFHYMGMLFLETKRYDDAIKAYSKALSIDPENHDLHVALGSCFLATQRSEEAIVSFKKAESISTQSLSKLLLGRALLDAGKNQESDAIFNACIQENPDIKAQVAVFKTMALG